MIYSRQCSDPDTDFDLVSGSGSRRAKKTYINKKIEGISCFEVLDVLIIGLKASPPKTCPLWRPRDK
jgi:hypothetical protein